MLFEIAPRPDAPAGTFVPKFVLSYLSDLPCCTVFTEAGAVEGRRMLVEWGQRYPCLPRNILQAFASDSLCLFTSSPDFPNLCLCPAPTFFEGDELIAAQVPRPEHIEMAPIPDQEDLPIDLPVRLIPDSGPTPSTAALILDAEETVWVRRLLYRLPGQAFGAYSLCLGQESSVLLGEGMPVELLPFGSPMRRVQDTQLFLPLRTRLIPDLPWNVLAEVLEMKDNVYTFLTLDFRLDLPRNAFAPLSKALVAESGRPRVAFDLCPTPDLPELKWTGDRGQLAVGSRQSAVGNLPLAPPRREKRQGAKGRGQKAEGSGKHPPAPPQEGKPTPAPSQEGNMEEMLRERAESFRQDRDHLSAAFCFALAGDNTNAARCYQEAAQHAKAGK